MCMKPDISTGTSIELVWIVKEGGQKQSHKPPNGILGFSIDHCKKLRYRQGDQNLAERFVALRGSRSSGTTSQGHESH